MISRAIGFYQKSLRNYPIIAQAVQVGVLMGCSDVISQKLIERKNDINWTRTAKFASVGFFFVGPLLRNWYGFLDRRIGTTGKYIGFKKMACDQILFAPCFIAVLLVMFNILQEMPFDDSLNKAKKDYPDVLTTNYLVWPAVQTINFSLVPLNYQVLVAQIVALIWNTYMSWKAHKSDILLKI